MRRIISDRRPRRVAAGVVCFLGGWLSATCSVQAQEHGSYILGDNQRLMIVVHIMGEVKRPGEFTVDDRTSVVELLSKAGGASEFANLSEVTVTRTEHPSYRLAGADVGASDSTHVLHVDIKAYLEGRSAAAPLLLEPGDIVSVPTNRFFTWRRVSGIARDLSIVASTYFLYLRAVHNN